MSDSERQVFPVETVLALVSAKPDADIKDIASYIVGRSVVCPKIAAAMAPFAGAWLARIYPNFAELVWDEKQDWAAFVSRAAKTVGDRVSLPPMSGALQAAALAVIDDAAAKREEIAALRNEVAKLSAEIETYKPLPAKLAAAEKKRDTLDSQLKAMKKDMGGLRRQVAGFEGKIALDQEELLDAIKDAIKENMKSITVAAAPVAGAAAAAGAAAGAAAAAPAGDSGDAGFGFGGDAGDGFGFSDGFGGGFGDAAPAAAAEPEPAAEFGFGETKQDEFGFGF